MSTASRRLTPGIFLRIMFSCSKAILAYVHGLHTGSSWLTAIGEPSSQFQIQLCAEHSLDSDAFIRGFITGYNYRIKVRNEEEAERGMWHGHSLFARWHHGYYSKKYPLRLPLSLASFLLEAVALFTTRSLVVVFFIMGLGIMTLFGVNILNFFICIREEWKQ